MKSVIKNICQTIQSIFHFCIWIIKLIIRKNFRIYIKKDRHTENVYILGNGPSLNIALEKINDATNTKICVVNFAILSPLFKKIKPHRKSLPLRSSKQKHKQIFQQKKG